MARVMMLVSCVRGAGGQNYAWSQPSTASFIFSLFFFYDAFSFLFYDPFFFSFFMIPASSQQHLSYFPFSLLRSLFFSFFMIPALNGIFNIFPFLFFFQSLQLGRKFKCCFFKISNSLLQTNAVLHTRFMFFVNGKMRRRKHTIQKKFHRNSTIWVFVFHATIYGLIYLILPYNAEIMKM